MSGNSIAIGICTFRRASLAATLASIERQELQPRKTLSVIVADNDETPSAETLVRGLAEQSRHRVTYLHAPSRNISIARNAILQAARADGETHLALIDDDEIAPPFWLERLEAKMRETGADAVVGPVRATYEAGAPGWMRAARMHDTWPETGRDGRPIAGHSCNVLIDLSAPAFAGLRFDPALGRSGGEDTAWFASALKAGARLALARDAVLTETVAPERATLAWLLRRRYRMGQTHVHMAGLPRPARAALALAKIAWSAGAALVLLPRRKSRNRHISRAAFHTGVLSQLIGGRRMSLYGGDDRAETTKSLSAARTSAGSR
jgi:succinoglycan biosynthesis protein ExoM